MSDETAAVESEETEYSPDVAVAFKQRAEEALHRYANEKNLCGDYDSAVSGPQVGLRGRPSWYDRYGYRQPGDLTGEDTEEDFRDWKRTAERRLHELARYHGLEREAVDEAMVAAGFRPRAEVWKTVDAVIKGTFEVPLQVEVAEGADLVQHITPAQVRERVYQQFMTDEVHWKAVVPAEAPGGEPVTVLESVERR